MTRNNNIRGPTSALTEFLKDSGITATTIARRAATRPQNDNDGQPVAGPSTAPAASTSRGSRRRRPTQASGYNSDDLDDPEGEEEQEVPAKKRKLTKAAEAKQTAKAKKKMKGSDDDDYNDEDDAYTALSKSLWTNNGNSSSKPPVGSFEECAVCEKQFTVTKYTMAANPGPGYLCHTCAKASGNDPFKKPAPKKRQVPADKRTITHFVESRFPSLVSLCIDLVTKHIDDIEALGDIGTMNMEAISKALSKNRRLTPENAKLFYNASNLSLTLFDATNLPSPALESLVYLNANLTSLRLDFCGLLDDAAFKVFSTSLPALTRIELLGPFLVRTGAWQTFFKSHPILEGFLITQSPRFDVACAKSLVQHCPGLKELRLKEIGKMSDEFIEEIMELGVGLTYLDISDPTDSCSNDTLIGMLSVFGAELMHLNLSKHRLITDRFLSDGLGEYTQRLDSLLFSHLPELTDKGVADFFGGWKGHPALRHLELARNHELGSAALEAIMKHSGKRLEELNINGWKEVGEDALRAIGRRGGELRRIDVSWCREMDDFIMKAWFEGEDVRGVRKGGCMKVKEIKVWGCNKITKWCQKKSGASIHGVESHVVR